ncbi:MAG: AAA family ATPase, partial [Acetobacteraceae bacterium]
MIDLLAAQNAPDAPDRLVAPWRGSAERAPKVIAIFGPNASGKSNVLKALTFVAWFARETFQLAPDQPLPFERFRDAQSGGAPTRLAVAFGGPADPASTEPDAPECRYSYELVLGGPSDAPARVLG